MTQEEKLEEAKRLYETANADQRYVLESLFPELCESEDERIRKEMIIFFENYHDPILSSNRRKDTWLAWLEKQSKKSKVEQAMREVEEKADAFTEAHKGETSDEILAQMRGEQNPAWSEEDETMWAEISDLLWEGYKQSSSKFSWDDIRNWVNPKLKSLRPQNTWKPSEEQIEALDDFIYAKYPNIEKYGAAVKSLYQDLKKLREE